MELFNDIVLRPRCKFDVDTSSEKLLKGFEATKISQSNFIVTKIDAHGFLKFPKQKQPFWSPPLYLESNKKKVQTATISGLF